jgi:hypothetical protein
MRPVGVRRDGQPRCFEWYGHRAWNGRARRDGVCGPSDSNAEDGGTVQMWDSKDRCTHMRMPRVQRPAITTSGGAEMPGTDPCTDAPFFFCRFNIGTLGDASGDGSSVGYWM